MREAIDREWVGMLVPPNLRRSGIKKNSAVINAMHQDVPSTNGRLLGAIVATLHSCG